MAISDADILKAVSVYLACYPDEAASLSEPLTLLVLQRHSVEWVAAAFVVAEASLVLASAPPV